MIYLIKKVVLFVALGSSLHVSAQSFATAANPVDCNGITHDLFAELDAGKIIVIGWTMPCITCAAPLLEVHNAVVQFAISDPGVVEYWMNDDYANTNCASVEGWSTSNGITYATFFSTSELSMFDYGGAGMPKVIVLACMDHKVYYNVNDTPTGQGVTTAINTALNEIDNGCLLGWDELLNESYRINCYPNPTNGELHVELVGEVSQSVFIEIRSLTGETLFKKSLPGLSELSPYQINLKELSGGIYFANIRVGNHSNTQKIMVTN